MVECPYCSFCFLSIFHAVSQYCAFIFLIAFFFCQPLLFEHPCAYSPTGICQAQSWLDAALQAGQGTCSSCMNVLLLVVWSRRNSLYRPHQFLSCPALFLFVYFFYRRSSFVHVPSFLWTSSSSFLCALYNKLIVSFRASQAPTLLKPISGTGPCNSAAATPSKTRQEKTLLLSQLHLEHHELFCSIMYELFCTGKVTSVFLVWG